jgi:amino acid transporter
MEYFIFIFLFVFPVIYFSTEQVLRSRKEKKPLAFYVKRFVGGLSIFAFGGAIFGVTWFLVNLFISSLVDFSTLLIVAGAIFFVIWGFIVFRFREKFKSISEGSW